LFDYGGVIAEEGFRAGLFALAGRQGLDPMTLLLAGADAVYSSGFVLGQADERKFWAQLREETGLQGSDEALTGEILPRFTLRPAMLDLVAQLKDRGLLVGILSDQTDWLERLEVRDRFFHHFDRVFNSWHWGKGKRDVTFFTEVAADLGLAPGQILFIDDLPGNVARAQQAGMRAILYPEEGGIAGLVEAGLRG